MNRYERISDKLQYQTHLVLRKLLKKKQGREVTNADIQLALFQYKNPSVQSDPDSIERLESLREGLTHLFKYEMEMVKLKHWEGMSNLEIARHFKKSESWVVWKMSKIYGKIKNGISLNDV